MFTFSLINLDFYVMMYLARELAYNIKGKLNFLELSTSLIEIR